VGPLKSRTLPREVRVLMPRSRRGIALPAAMFTLVAMAVLVGGLYTFADLGAKSVRNRESSSRAVHVAEAGVAHTLGLLRGGLRMHSYSRILRGSDDIVNTADDSLLVGWGLAAGDQIPLAGQTYQGHTYFVTVRDDPADGDANPATDLNGRVQVRCRAVTADGATAEVEAIIASVPQAAIATDGNANYSGTPQVLGVCGGVHANGNLSGGGNPIVQTQASASGVAGGNFRLPNGSDAPRLSGQAEVPIPDLAPLDFCVGADFRLRADGVLVDLSTGIESNATGVPVNGWKRSSGPPEVKWDLSGPASVNGTYCVEGNASISGNTGSALTPRRMSVVATGSIEVAGNPFITPDHDDGILFLAGGDVALSGNPTAGASNFSGLVYAGAQCKTSGNFTVFGQIMCANAAQPAGSINHVSTHDMSGNWTLNFDCSGNVFNKRRVLYWYPRIGT
jgi:hypothetical protein